MLTPACSEVSRAVANPRESSTCVIGIDPGQTSGLAVLSAAGEISLLVEVPIISDRRITRIDGGAFHSLLVKAVAGRPARAIVERISIGKARGIPGAFVIGVDYGAILGVLQALYIQTEFIKARRWKPAMSAGRGGRCLDEARRLYPCADLFKDDGPAAEARAGALLLAHYALHRSAA